MKIFLEFLYHIFGAIITWLMIHRFIKPQTKEQTVMFFIAYAVTSIILMFIKRRIKNSKKKILLENGETELDYINPKQINSKRRKNGNI